MTNLHNRKLSNLISRSPWNNYGDNSNVLNLSSKPLSNEEKIALELGMKFNNPSKKPNILKIQKAFEEVEKHNTAFQNTDRLTLAKGIVYSAYMKHVDCCYFPKRLNIALKKIASDDDIHITRADKANTIVIMDKLAYVDKMNILLNDQETYEKLTSNPLERINAEFHQNIREIFEDNQQLINKFKQSSSSLSYLYGVIKTHKDDYPVRPIISTVGSVQYSLSKFLVNLLQPLVGNISNSHITNSVEFVTKAKDISINQNCRLVSFDVRSLFTCVPVMDLLDFLNIELNKYVFSIPVESILRLTRLCVIDTCFVFNDNYYKQKFGMQMGNCLSPVLSNIYMEFYETRIANTIIPDDVYWVRYVDDTFTVWKTNHDIDSFLLDLNSLVPSIKFTIEKETNNTISFLDVKVIREENNLKFKIYRKEANNNLMINAKSTHRDNVKYMALRSHFLRALRLVSPEYLDEEIHNITMIGMKNNFHKDEIENCLSLAKKTYYNVNRNKEMFEVRNSIILPFHPCLEDIVYPLKILNLKVIFSYNNTIGRTIIRNSPKQEEGVVYQIPCECGKFYLGQTSKTIQKRISQHDYCIRTNAKNNAINLHVNNCGMPILWNKAKIMYKEKDTIMRNILETACIDFSKHNNFNNSPGMYKLNPLFLHIVTQQYKFKERF